MTQIATARPPSPGVGDPLAADRPMLIGGEWVFAQSGRTIAVIDPASEATFATVPAAEAADIDLAVQAARRAFEAPSWARLRPVDRERLLLKLADLVEAAGDELAALESRDNGKSVTMAKRVDVRGAVDHLRYVAGWATKIEGATVDVSFPKPRGGGDYVAYTRREPVGVVGAIIPWNFPLMMAAWKIGPALATGCSVILKPAEETPLTALRLGQLALEAGFPPGVLNVVTGYGHIAGAALVNHPGVDKIAFTGSTEVGKLIAHAGIERMARFSLELGGKSPVMIFDDADIDTAIAGAASAIFFNHGQVCCAGSRLYVQRSIFERVTDAIAAQARAIRPGPGSDPKCQMGPLVSAKQRDRVMGFVAAGLEQGAKALAGGTRPEGAGYFMTPTVLVDVDHAMTPVREEIFGPVLVAMPFDDEDDVVRLANDSIYGLAAGIWTKDLGRAHRVAARVKAGTVWINCHNLIDPALPFGGFKQSGIGREMGRAGIDLYTETKSVCIQI